MSHAINSHVLTSTNPCINLAIHMLLMHGIAVLRITFAGNILFHAIIGTGKKEILKQFLQCFRAKKMFLCNNSDQTCFSDALTSAGPHQARVSTLPLGPSRC